MENVNDLTQQAAAAAGQMSDGTIELTKLAQQLKELVEQFAVGEGNHVEPAASSGVPAVTSYAEADARAS
jgi:hypothetical protein